MVRPSFSPFGVLIALLVLFPLLTVVPAALGLASAASPVPSSFLLDVDEEDEKEQKKEIPPPPSNNLEVPQDLEPKIREQFDEAMQLYAIAQKDRSKKSRRKEAIRALKRLKNRMPYLPLFYLGILYQSDGNFKKARKVLEELIEKSPGFYEAYVELGDVEVWEKKLPKAIPHYEKALDIYPYFEYGVDRMMWILVEIGRFEEARPFVERAIERGENGRRLLCKKAVKDAIESPDWGETFLVESEHYVVKTSVSEDFAQTVSETAELIRDLYDVTFPEIKKPDRKYLVLVFSDRQGYLDSGMPENSGGLYMSFSRTMHLFKKKTLADTLMTLKHEGFHQYCHEYLDNIPAWFNEGLADYFSTSELVMVGKKRAIQIRPNRKRLGYLVRAFESGMEYPDLARLMNMTQAEMYDVKNDSKLMYLHYCQAWAICYFCIQGGNKQYQATLKGYFKALRKGKSASAAYRTTFGKINMKRFQERWRKFMGDTWTTDKGV